MPRDIHINCKSWNPVYQVWYLCVTFSGLGATESQYECAKNGDRADENINKRYFRYQ